MKRWFGLGLVLGLIALMLIAATWNSTWESLPQGTELASNLDTRIQEFKAEVRKRASVENIWGNTTADNGLTRLGSGRVFVDNSAPTDIAGPGQYNSAAGTYSGTALTTTEQGGTHDIGAGRVWIDPNGPDEVSGTSDDRQLYVWDETLHAWNSIRSEGFMAAGVGGDNLIYNGGFEITDGFGGTGTPAGWTLVNTPTIAYVDPTLLTPNEGAGIALKTTATGSSLEGVRQALPKLKASTTYVYRARGFSVSGVFNGCTLKVSDGTTTSTATTQGFNFETLEVLHTTTGAPATVNVDLLSTNDTDICEWDEITAYEQNQPTRRGGIQTCFDTDNSTGAYTNPSTTWNDALVSCAVTPPGPGYIIQIRGQIVASNDTGQVSSLAGRIRENGTTTRGMATVYVGQDDTNADHFQDVATVPVFSTIVNPTPGTTLTYTLEALSSKGGTATWRHNIGTDAGAEGLNGDSANLLTTLEVTLVPTR